MGFFLFFLGFFVSLKLAFVILIKGVSGLSLITMKYFLIMISK